MTEPEWLASEDPQAMLGYLQSPSDNANPNHIYPPSDRKLRLFACACVRQVWHRLSDHQRASVVFAESEPWHQAALGGVHAVYTSQDAITEYTRSVGDGRCINYAIGWLGAQNAHEVASQSPAWLQRLVSLPTQAALLRDIVGSPWHTYYIEEDNEITYRDCEDSSAQEGHTKSLDQGGGPGRLEDASSLGMGTGWRATSAGRLPDSSHQRRQHGRQADQPGLDPSRGASADARRQAAGEADGAKVSADNTQLQPVWMRVSGTQAKPQSSLLSVSQGKQKGASGKAIPTNGRVIKRSWLTPTVLSLAQAAYEESQPNGTLNPDRLAILADALEEAGCTNEVLLQHLRGWEWSPPEDHMGRDKGVWIRLRGPHVRGCWALDLILGKN